MTRKNPKVRIEIHMNGTHDVMIQQVQIERTENFSNEFQKLINQEKTDAFETTHWDPLPNGLLSLTKPWSLINSFGLKCQSEKILQKCPYFVGL